MTREYAAAYSGRPAVETIPYPILGAVAICDACRTLLINIGAYESE
ncbi:hypothetical protein GCM10010341_32040 [Streptomyces noursei]|nr:hypothetical protein GCM10010341_32040 [Streptomyces noursei]